MCALEVEGRCGPMRELLPVDDDRASDLGSLAEVSRHLANGFDGDCRDPRRGFGRPLGDLLPQGLEYGPASLALDLVGPVRVVAEVVGIEDPVLVDE